MANDTQRLILTAIGDDRPGLVEELATTIAAHGGNWLEASMSQLSGKFAGIVEVAIPAAQAEALKAALGKLKGLKVGIEAAAEQKSAPTGRHLTLNLVGHDRIGIVREVAQVSAPAKARSLSSTASSTPRARVSRRASSACGGPMVSTVTLPPYWSLTSRAASTAYQS